MAYPLSKESLAFDIYLNLVQQMYINASYVWMVLQEVRSRNKVLRRFPMNWELLHRRTGFGVEDPNSPSQVNAS